MEVTNSKNKETGEILRTKSSVSLAEIQQRILNP
jgi:hypothetical protein